MEQWKAGRIAWGYGMFRGCRYCNWHETRDSKTLEDMKAEGAGQQGKEAEV